MRVAFDHFRLVLEPSGALALAAVLDGHERDLHERLLLAKNGGGGNGGDGNGGGGGGLVLPAGRAVGVVLSGGNTDLGTYARMMGCTNRR